MRTTVMCHHNHPVVISTLLLSWGMTQLHKLHICMGAHAATDRAASFNLNGHAHDILTQSICRASDVYRSFIHLPLSNPFMAAVSFPVSIMHAL